MDAQVVELTLRGVFEDGSYEKVVALIRAMCVESGYLGEFREWEKMYKNPDDPMSSVRFRHNLLPDAIASVDTSPYKSMYLLRYLGKPEPRVHAPCQKYTALEVRVGTDPSPLLTALGFFQHSQYLRRGHRFRSPEDLLVEVYKIEKVTNQDVNDATPMQGGVVEIIRKASADRHATTEELLTFASYLAPTVVVPGTN